MAATQALQCATGYDVIRVVPNLKPVLLVLLLCCSACAPQGDVTPSAPPVVARTPGAPSETPYYVEFRASPNVVGGHTYLAYGALGKDGKPAEEKVIGFAPWGGVIGIFVGMIAAPADLTQTTFDEKGLDIDKFRHRLTAGEYAHLVAFIAKEQRHTHVYNLFLNNCNDFAADAAQVIGLRVPSDRFVPAPLFVLMLSSMNA